MRRKFIKTRFVAMGLATAMVFSMAQVPAVGNWQPPMVNVVQAAEKAQPLYSNTESVTTDELELPEEDWSDSKPIIAIDESITDVTVAGDFTMTADVILDEVSYNSLGEEGDYLKLQGVVKLGEDWTWTDSQKIPYLEQKNFEKDGDVYKTSIEIPFSEIESNSLRGVYFVVVAQGFAGQITFSNVALSEKEDETKAVPFYTGSADVETEALDLPEEDWGDDKPVIAIDESIEDVTVTENFTMTADITLDEETYNSLGEEGDYLKLQGVVKLGEDWTWTDSQKIPYLEQKNFEKDGDVYKTSIEIPFSDIEPNSLRGVYFVVVAQGFSGKITFSNVALTPVVKTAEPVEELVYSSSESQEFDAIDFSALEEEDWNTPPTMTYATGISDVVLAENAVIKGTITIDKDLYDSLDAEGSYVKLQSVVKIGTEEDWTQSGDYPYLDKNAFTENEGVYSADFTAKLSDIAGGDLLEIIFRVVGIGAKGTASISNVTISNRVKTGVTKEELVYTGSETQEFDAIDFSTLEEEDWNTPPTMTYATGISDVVLAENAVIKGTITIDKDLYDSLDAEGSYVKLQSVVRIGTEEDWTQSGDYPYLDKNAFTENEGVYSADFTAKLSDIAGGDLLEIIFRVVGIGAKGTASISNVTISNLITTGGEEELPEKEPTVVADFEEADAGTADGWENESGWQYDKEVVPTVSEANGSKALELPLDYTGCEGYTWSEAKVKKAFEEGLDVSAYNMLTYDLIYPKALDGSFKVKVFAKEASSETEIINKEGILETKDLGDGNMLAKVTVKFSPNTAKITDLTIGTVGVSTDFVGSVYLDNITLSQYNPAGDFVDITSEIGDAASVDVSVIADTKVSLADSNATDTTKALYAYLKHLDAQDQVLFGHQNDTHKHVTSREDVYSDTKDITGSISGLVGIDSLALTGAELGLKNTAEAVAKSIEIGKEAAAEGAIITLSTHMPNMSNEKIVKNEDGTYDFSACDFEESKDLSNNCAEESLPGGKYNDRFTAYLDIIAEYAKGLGDTPVLFRPFHECDGGWFWWGSAATDADTYKALYQYTVDYLTEKGVHNFIYVYSPGGPINETSYMKRYPGKNYVDILGFDYYDDYSSATAEYSDTFMKSLESSCNTLKAIADKEGKLAAISEAGVRVMKEDGSDQEGILVKNNPIKGQNWYSQVNNVAKETGMSYFLLWANFSDTNFYVPYKYNDTKGQELINEFIDFYNEDSSIFANGTNFYGKASEIETTDETQKDASGYFENVFSKMTIPDEKTLKAVVKNLPEDKEVAMVVENTETGEKVSLTVESKGTDKYEAVLTKADIEKVGATDAAKITLMAGDQELAVRKYITLGKERATLAKNVVEDFELYYGDNDYIDSIYGVNSAAGCDSSFTLEKTDKASGNYAGAFNYTLKTEKNEVWTGRKKSMDTADYSDYNALSLWVKPDGKGQKLVIQLVSNGEDFEAFLTDFAATTEAQYVTIPFDKLKGKNGGKFDPKNVTNFAVWCNSIPGTATDIQSQMLFDDVQFVYVDEDSLGLAEGQTYKTSDDLIGSTEGQKQVEESKKKAEAVVEKINAIGAVSYDEVSKAKIDEARKAYDALTASEKALVSEEVLKKLTDAEKTYDDLKQAAEEEAAAEEAAKKKAAEVTEKINAIGTVSYSETSKAKIEEARKAYDALTASEKAFVTEDVLKKLTDAEKTYDDLKQAAEEEAAAEEAAKKKAAEVTEKINAIGTVSYSETSKAKIEEARKAYDALTASEKAFVTEDVLKKLTDAEKTYGALKQAAEEEAAAKEAAKKKAAEVTEKINAIGTVSYSETSKAKIEEARKAYDALTASEKAFVTEDVLKKLTDAEKTYSELKQDAEKKAEESKKKVENVKRKINVIGIVLYDTASKNEIEEARKAYDALTDSEKALISKDVLKKLTDAEERYENLKKTAVSNKLEVVKVTDGSVNLKWNAENGAAGYNVYAYDDGSKQYVKVADVVGTEVEVTAINGKTLNPATTYQFKVVACNAYKNEMTGTELKVTATTAATQAVTPVPAKVEAPSKVTISSLKNSGTKAALKWKKVSDATGYQIYMKTGSGKYKLVKTIKKGTTVKYTKTKLKKGTKYTFKVRAYKTVNGKKVYGAYSKAKSVKVK